MAQSPALITGLFYTVCIQQNLTCLDVNGGPLSARLGQIRNRHLDMLPFGQRQRMRQTQHTALLIRGFELVCHLASIVSQGEAGCRAWGYGCLAD